MFGSRTYYERCRAGHGLVVLESELSKSETSDAEEEADPRAVHDS